MFRSTALLGALLLMGTVTCRGESRPPATAFRLHLKQDTDEKVQARELVTKGVAAYREADFDSAIEYFKQAKELDPTFVNARLYLATAYASKYIPGAPSEDNTNLGEKAIEEFKEVLRLDPNNLSAIDGIGSILYNLADTPFDPKKFEESKSYHKLHIKLKPDDPQPYYWVGVIDWAQTYRKNKVLRSTFNQTADEELLDDEPMPPSLTAEFIQDCEAAVGEGIDYMKKAIQLDPDYDDAMAYLNLLYRQKADMEWTIEEREKDLKLADDLVEQIKKIAKKRMGTQPPKLD